VFSAVSSRRANAAATRRATRFVSLCLGASVARFIDRCAICATPRRASSNRRTARFHRKAPQGLHRRREETRPRRRRAQASRANGSCQLPVLVDDVAERESARGSRRAPTTVFIHSGRGAGELAGDVHRDRPHRPVWTISAQKNAAPSENDDRQPDRGVRKNRKPGRRTSRGKADHHHVAARLPAESPVRWRMRSLNLAAEIVADDPRQRTPPT